MSGWGGGDDEDDSLAIREAANAERQSEWLLASIRQAQAPGAGWRLELETLHTLNRLSTEETTPRPGEFRDRDVEISGSRHVPPEWPEVPVLTADCLARLNSWSGDVIDQAAWALWRINWIHPYEDGNGRTARAVAYMLLCVGVGQTLPGVPTLLERLIRHKLRYYRALEAADLAARDGREDVASLAALMRELLEAQLRGDP